MTGTTDLHVERCRRALSFLEPVTDTTVAQGVPGALDELEAGYSRPTDRSKALRVVRQKICSETARMSPTPFQRFLMALIEQRLNAAPYPQAG